MSIRHPVIRNLAYAQASFYLSVLLCVIVAPDSLAANTGLSYFGVHVRTVGLFIAGILMAAFYTWLALKDFPDKPFAKPLRFALSATIPLMIGILATPYTWSQWAYHIHDSIGSALFTIQLLTAFWFIVKVKADILNGILLAIQLAGGIISLIYLFPAHGFLIQGQLLFQVAFSVLLFRNLRFIV